MTHHSKNSTIKEKYLPIVLFVVTPQLLRNSCDSSEIGGVTKKRNRNLCTRAPMCTRPYAHARVRAHIRPLVILVTLVTLHYILLVNVCM